MYIQDPRRRFITISSGTTLYQYIIIKKMALIRMKQNFVSMVRVSVIEKM